MKVAILSPVTWRTPPRKYGPWEQVVSVLTESLVNSGIDVTLFATGDSITRSKLQSVCSHPIGEFPADAKVSECLHISHVMEQAATYDIIHNHFDFLPLTYSRLINTPVITTIHGFSSEDIVPVYKKYNGHSYYVSISNSNRHRDLDYLDTVYNGIDEALYSYGSGMGDYLLYFGRIHPDKGTAEAIQIARQAGKKLIMCGLVQDQSYYDKEIMPHVDGHNIQYLGNVGPEKRNALMGDALALLHPISFEEPFGLSVVESMMCGTPVIAFDRGSMKELIVENKTGFLVRNCQDAAEAVHSVQHIDRRICRQHAIDLYSSRVMAGHYLRLYEKVARRRGSL
ncbi:glycosyltransferase family 4 protein [Paraflavitalea pollutisoli]|uniref:glycosyltransferase family 4 protein n=1 Tax=Paraflavitalea pollutisoli TaxID=3034143 RepID=UPI0023EAE243|nr:glycosyltransferase family 4 protein [Paraflavitalea sp. H1-2-19X]